MPESVSMRTIAASNVRICPKSLLCWRSWAMGMDTQVASNRLIFMGFPKEPSPALSGTLSHPLDGRGGIDLRRSAKRTGRGGHLINGKIVAADLSTSIE